MATRTPGNQKFEYAPAPESRSIVDIKPSYGLFIDGEFVDGHGKAFKTVIGDLGYDKKGDITRLDYVMYTWKKGGDGKITYVQQ